MPLTGPGGAVEGAIYVTRSTLPVVAAMHRLRTTLWLVLLAAIATTAVLTLFLGATIARPLSRLTRIARRIAAGDRREGLALDRRDEIGELARAFDEMARRLDARAQETAELAANVSHEFKSPLTSLRGAAELLLEGAADDPAARERFLRNMVADAGRLDRLLTRLLELSRTDADRSPVEPLDLSTVVQDAVAACRGLVPMDVRYESARRMLIGRRAALLSMLGNLLDNAQQAAAPGSRITVTVADIAPGRLAVHVHDRGAPIAPANLGRIWERFFTTRAGTGGTGLGLPIVASVARSHGGHVSVASDATDGTTFTVELPID